MRHFLKLLSVIIEADKHFEEVHPLWTPPTGRALEQKIVIGRCCTTRSRSPLAVLSFMSRLHGGERDFQLENFKMSNGSLLINHFIYCCIRGTVKMRLVQ